MDWREEAACKGQTKLMYPDNWGSGQIAKALAVCAECPVRAECLAETMVLEGKGQRFGIAGGLTAPDRYRLAGQTRYRLAPRSHQWRAAS